MIANIAFRITYIFKGSTSNAKQINASPECMAICMCTVFLLIFHTLPMWIMVSIPHRKKKKFCKVDFNDIDCIFFTQ